MGSLKKVTITGADDNTNVADMVRLSNKYPFVEWGILLSKSSEGGYRFPSASWIKDVLAPATEENKLQLAGHLCGVWVRDLLMGNWTFREDRPGFMQMFRRIQINTHGNEHQLNMVGMNKCLGDFPSKQWIFQMDGTNDKLRSNILSAGPYGFHGTGLFDLSGGSGILPDEWPTSTEWAGYAGGLSHENVAQQLAIISEKAGGDFWIDAERRLRSESDKFLMMDKCEAYLEAASKFIK